LLLSLSLPDWVEESWLEQFFEEMFVSIERFDPTGELVLAGGDLSGAERFTAHITACGEAPAGRSLRRGGASSGDLLYVSGALGGAALGLERVLADAFDESDPAVARHWRPEPRLALGAALRESGATAAIDLSDGLSSDVVRLAAASGLQAVVELDRIPVFAGASTEQALHGGEEYELLFAVPPGLEPPAELAGSRLSRIGVLRQGSGAVVLADGAERPLEPRGFDHFRHS